MGCSGVKCIPQFSQIRLEGIKCFLREQVIDFAQPSRDKPSWTLVLGDNGTGKSTLLRCIALCLCDETSASGLLRERQGDFISHGRREATIKVTLSRVGADCQAYVVTTTLKKKDSRTEELEQKALPGF